MSYGLQCYDGAGRLVFDSNIPAYALGYIGAFTFSADNGSFFTDYTVNHPTRPIPFIVYPNNGSAVIGIESITSLGSNNWRIRLIDMLVSGTGRSRPTIHCFGRATGTPASTFGLQCFRADGSCDFDTTRGLLNVSLTSDVPGLYSTSTTQPVESGIALGGVSNAAVRFSGSGTADRYTGGSPTGIRRQFYRGATLSGTTLTPNWGLRDQYNEDGGITSTGLWLASAQRLLVINTAKFT
jgi:hypothetical protein